MAGRKAASVKAGAKASKAKPTKRGRGGTKASRGARAKGTTRADKKARESGTTRTAATVKRAKMYTTVYDEWLQGRDSAAIATKHKITPRRVEQIADELRAVNYTASTVDSPLTGMKIVDRLLAQLEYAVSQAAELYERSLSAGHYSAALGSLKRIAEARREHFELQQARGIVPRNLGVLHAQWDGMMLVNSIFDIHERYNVPDEVSEAIANVIEMQITRDHGRLELDMHTGMTDEQIDAPVTVEGVVIAG